VSGDRLLVLFASLLGVKDMAAPVDASMVLDDMIGRPVVRTRVGDMFVSEALKKKGLPFGGEPSGTFIFPQVSYCPDGMLAGAELIKLLDGRPLSEVVDTLPRYPSERASFPFEAKDKVNIWNRLAEEMSSLEGEVTTVDGIRVDLGSGWLLVRMSGTEPKVRLTAEARNEKDLKIIVNKACSKIKRALD